jgi:hypothetical protein
MTDNLVVFQTSLLEKTVTFAKAQLGHRFEGVFPANPFPGAQARIVSVLANHKDHPYLVYQVLFLDGPEEGKLHILPDTFMLFGNKVRTKDRRDSEARCSLCKKILEPGDQYIKGSTPELSKHTLCNHD